MYQDVEIKLKKKNKILFSFDSMCLQEIITLMAVSYTHLDVYKRQILN